MYDVTALGGEGLLKLALLLKSVKMGGGRGIKKSQKFDTNGQLLSTYVYNVGK